MNNIEACRQPARDMKTCMKTGRWETVSKETEERLRCQHNHWQCLLCVESEERRGDVGEPGLKSDVPRKLSETSGLRWLTCKRHDSSQTPAQAALLHHSLPLRVPSSAPAEIWRLPSLINVKAAPINIFISAWAPCWKHILGDFSLYELISYLQRQLNMPSPFHSIFFSSRSLWARLLPHFCRRSSTVLRRNVSIWGSHGGQRI